MSGSARSSPSTMHAIDTRPGRSLASPGKVEMSMRTTFIALAALGVVAFAAPAAHADDARPRAPQGQPLMSGEHAGRIREEIRLHEQRAKELEPIIARDRQ